MLYDTHAHIQFRGYDADRENVIARITEKNTVLNLVGTQKDTSKLAVELAEQHDNMYASIGTHPVHLFPTHVDEEESQFISREEGFDEAYYTELAKSPKVIGVGETGLDLFHVPKDKTVEEVLEKQKQVFLAHADFAEKHNLALVIHCRDAHEQMIELLEKRGKQVRGTVHCFTGNWSQAQRYMALGLHLGFTGIVTFPPKKTDPAPQLELQEVVERIPLDRILLETDSPYLAPQAYRGKRAEPWMVEEVINYIASVRNISREELEQQIATNTKHVFNIS